MAAHHEPKPPNLSLTQTIHLADMQIPVRFCDKKALFPDYQILGWDETGFILNWGSRIDTVSYELFEPYIQICTDKTNSGRGAITGLIIGLPFAALIVYLGIDIYKNSKNDLRVLGLIYAIATTPVILGLSAFLGALSGSRTYQYDTYRYDYHQFQNNPWLSDRYYEILMFQDGSSLRRRHPETNLTAKAVSASGRRNFRPDG